MPVKVAEAMTLVSCLPSCCRLVRIFDVVCARLLRLH